MDLSTFMLSQGENPKQLLGTKRNVIMHFCDNGHQTHGIRKTLLSNNILDRTVKQTIN